MEYLDIAKKVYEYATYLESSAKKMGVEAEHEIITFASSAKEHAEKIYIEGEEKAKELAKVAGDTLKEKANEIKEASESLVEEFHKLLGKK